MKSEPLSIAYGDEPSRRSSVLAETLRSQGHAVTAHDEARALLSAPEPDVYVLGGFAGGMRGLELLSALRRAGRSAPVVLIDEKPAFEDMRRAIELGAADIVLRPLEEGELARALERATTARPRKPRIDAEPRAHTSERSYTIDAHTVGRAARELSGFLVNEGVANAHRVRIASALAELVDNACRHAYPGSRGEVVVRAEVQRTRVQLVVEDNGSGFDVARARLERVPAALPGARRSNSSSANGGSSSNTGLGRVERLCEAHAISSSPSGTRVELTFELTPVRFDEEGEHLAETDFLDPSRARSLIASLRQGRADLSSVAPGMALTIGRILGGLDANVRRSAKE
jgi:anti-sigma regulatory factor (Ser/Thr protein kinase)/CheY-like chemotaxis protein